MPRHISGRYASLPPPLHPGSLPTQASLRDIGSLDGTYVNGKKWGGRKAGESPAEGAKHKFPVIELNDGDKITVGQTDFAVAIEKGAAQPAVKAGMNPGELSELSPEQLFELVFGAGKNDGGLQIPGYSVEKELGRGGFGAVYQARRKADGAQVAIKVMLSQTDATEEDVLKFQREMDVNSQLTHPNIVRFVESGSHAGAFYFVMALCDGGSLMDLFKENRGSLTPAQLIPHALKALEGLAFAHSEGFVHRDIKPGNILIHIILNEEVLPIRSRNPGISKPLAAVIDQSVTKKHKDRYRDAGEFLAALKK